LLRKLPETSQRVYFFCCTLHWSDHHWRYAGSQALGEVRCRLLLVCSCDSSYLTVYRATFNSSYFG